jgi:hypothetical protein
MVEFSGQAVSNNGGATTLALQEDGATIGGVSIGANGVINGPTRRVRRNPSAGSHTYQVVVVQLTSGTATVNAVATNPFGIYVVEA